MDKVRPIICEEHEYCEDCPCRVGCPKRPTFYDDESFNRTRNEAIVKTTQYLVSNGFSGMEAVLMVKELCDSYEKKRIYEMLLHPTYSEE